MITRGAGKYTLTVESKDGTSKATDYPFSGITNEFDYFIEAIHMHRKFCSQRNNTGFADQYFAKISAKEAARDAAYMFGMFKSAEDKKVVDI